MTGQEGAVIVPEAICVARWEVRERIAGRVNEGSEDGMEG